MSTATTTTYEPWDWPGFMVHPEGPIDFLTLFSDARTVAEVDAIYLRIKAYMDRGPAVRDVHFDWLHRCWIEVRAMVGVGADRLEIVPVEVAMPGADASPPMDKLDALLAGNARALGAVKRTLGFPSPSEHDMSFAHFAAGAGWKPQAIADTLAWVRRSRGEDPKHATYYRRTVDKAMREAGR